jgi:hypothetical protein
VFAAFGDPYAGLNFADVPTPSVIEVVFGLFGLPLGAGIVEELVYRRCRAWLAFRSRWVGLLIVALGFGLQHVGLALAADWRLALERGIALTIVGVWPWVAFISNNAGCCHSSSPTLCGISSETVYCPPCCRCCGGR